MREDTEVNQSTVKKERTATGSVGEVAAGLAEKKRLSLCLSFLPHSACPLYLNQLTHFLLCLSLFGDYNENEIAKIHPYYVTLQTVFCIRLFFHGEFTTRSTVNSG